MTLKSYSFAVIFVKRITFFDQPCANTFLIQTLCLV